MRPHLRRLRKRVRFAIDGRFGHLPQPRHWVFIAGCSNSGTTLLRHMLASHPQIGSLPTEGQFLTDQLPSPDRAGVPRLWAVRPELFYLTPASGASIDVTRLKRQWGARFDDPRRPVLLDSSGVNASRLMWLDAHFENAVFIGIVRNGFAVAEGIRRRMSYPLDLAALQWARCNEIMLRDLSELQRKTIVRYVSLTEEPDEILGRIFSQLDVSWPGASFDGRVFDFKGFRSPVVNLNARSLEALTETDRQTIAESAGPVLSRLGYM